MTINPFLTYGYAGAEYFCDRQEETARLTSLLVNGNHVALMSPRRMGKTGLLYHCFSQPDISANYYTFIVDIYATKSLAEFTYMLGKTILKTLKSKERQVWERFIQMVGSLRTGITFDEFGKPAWNLEVGDIKTPAISLDEIFAYLSSADKPCLVAIDEFQSIVGYEEGNVEATLRTYVQQCRNAWFVFSGSKRTMMGEIFNSPSRPFYQSATTISLKPIPLPAYSEFIHKHFHAAGKMIDDAAVRLIYERFEGTTWYVQKMANELFASCDECNINAVEPALLRIINENEDTYNEIMYRLTSKQKAVLVAVGKAGGDARIMSGAFAKAYSLPSASSIQKSVAALVDKEILTCNLGRYNIYDYFFRLWLQREF